MNTYILKLLKIVRREQPQTKLDSFNENKEERK